VAEDNFWQEIPFVYRTHEKPDPDRIKKLAAFINNFGYNIHTEGGELHPKELQKLLEKIADTPHETLISRLTLRSMKQAKYTVDETGHFGLASRYYCHFTSPIRRYPDLQIHRIIKDRLRGRMNDAKKEHYEKILPAVAKLSSERERRAEEAERDTVKLKKVQYMSGHMGERFTGVVSSVTAWGMYVELPNTVEGMVHVTSLKDDFYHYIEDSYELVGETTGKRYRLGQILTVTVTGTDELMRTIDFEV
jgi:ribonuclease R